MNLPMHDTAQSPSMALRLHGGAVRFGPRDGLRAIELSMARGERLALVGPSGSGKTSLLRAIAGLDAFAAGRLAIDDVDVTTMPPERRRCVYLHQTPALFPHLSVLDNVAFPLVLRGRGRSVAREQALALSNRCDCRRWPSAHRRA
jgi:ABC-type sugar transport system ATPase subunit